MSGTVFLILMGVGALIAIWFVLEVVVGIPLLILVKRAEGKAHDREVATRQMIALETLAVQQAASPVVAPQQTPLPVVPEPEPELKVDLTLPARVATALANMPSQTAEGMAASRRYILEEIAQSEADLKEDPENAAEIREAIEASRRELAEQDQEIIEHSTHLLEMCGDDEPWWIDKSRKGTRAEAEVIATRQLAPERVTQFVQDEKRRRENQEELLSQIIEALEDPEIDDERRERFEEIQGRYRGAHRRHG